MDNLCKQEHGPEVYNEEIGSQNSNILNKEKNHNESNKKFTKKKYTVKKMSENLENSNLLHRKKEKKKLDFNAGKISFNFKRITGVMILLIIVTALI